MSIAYNRIYSSINLQRVNRLDMAQKELQELISL